MCMLYLLLLRFYRESLAQKYPSQKPGHVGLSIVAIVDACSCPGPHIMLLAHGDPVPCMVWPWYFAVQVPAGLVNSSLPFLFVTWIIMLAGS